MSAFRLVLHSRWHIAYRRSSFLRACFQVLRTKSFCKIVLLQFFGLEPLGACLESSRSGSFCSCGLKFQQGSTVANTSSSTLLGLQSIESRSLDCKLFFFVVLVWLIAGGGSIPRWSASETQDRRPAERQRARTKKKAASIASNGLGQKKKQPRLQVSTLEQSSSWLSWYRGVLDVGDRLPVVVRFPAGPRVRLKTVDPPKGNGLGQKKRFYIGTSQLIQPTRYPQMRPQHHVQPLTNPPGHVTEPHERYRCKTTKPTAATHQRLQPKLHWKKAHRNQENSWIGSQRKKNIFYGHFSTFVTKQ